MKTVQYPFITQIKNVAVILTCQLFIIINITNIRFKSNFWV